MGKELQVSVSASDLTVIFGWERVFAGLKEAGADGIEIVAGLKSRWNLQGLKVLSDRYKLPITSIHEPFWSCFGITFDTNLFKDAANIGVDKLVFHPLPRLSFENEPMKRRLATLSDLQREYEVEVVLENMAKVIRPPGFRQLFPFHPDVTDPVKVDRAAFAFGLSTTFDTSHAYLPEPHNQEWFKEIFPRIGYIHLSSFDGKVDHLPLNMGDFRSEEFLAYLKKTKYCGLITLEVFYPRKVPFRNPNFNAIGESIKIVKERAV